MFIGEYHHAIDDKGRLAVPVKFRDEIGEQVVVTRGLDSCLFVYTQAEWAGLAERLGKLSMAKANTRAFARLMLAGAMEIEVDKQGRVILPDYLRTFAGLHKKVVIAGLLNRLEVWDAAAWKKYQTGTERKAGDIAEALGELGV